MDDPRWLRIVTIGLVLAALAVGYFLMTGKFFASKSQKVQTQGSQVVQQTPTAKPQVLGQNTPSPSPTPESAYSKIVSRKQANVQTLPRTGFPLVSLGFFSAVAITIGWGLRKFPH